MINTVHIKGCALADIPPSFVSVWFYLRLYNDPHSTSFDDDENFDFDCSSVCTPNLKLSAYINDFLL